MRAIYDSCDYPQQLPEPVGEARYGMVYLMGNQPRWWHNNEPAPAQVHIHLAANRDPIAFAAIIDGPASQTSPAFSYEDMDAGRVWAWVGERWSPKFPTVTTANGPDGDYTLLDGESVRPEMLVGVQPHHRLKWLGLKENNQ